MHYCLPPRRRRAAANQLPLHRLVMSAPAQKILVKFDRYVGREVRAAAAAGEGETELGGREGGREAEGAFFHVSLAPQPARGSARTKPASQPASQAGGLSGHRNLAHLSPAPRPRAPFPILGCGRGRRRVTSNKIS